MKEETLDTTQSNFHMHTWIKQKGRMDEPKLEKCLFINIISLDPDACNIPGKHILIKIDSGQGKINQA